MVVLDLLDSLCFLKVAPSMEFQKAHGRRTKMKTKRCICVEASLSVFQCQNVTAGNSDHETNLLRYGKRMTRCFQFELSEGVRCVQKRTLHIDTFCAVICRAARLLAKAIASTAAVPFLSKSGAGDIVNLFPSSLKSLGLC